MASVAGRGTGNHRGDEEQVSTVEALVLEALRTGGPQTIEQLASDMKQISWSQVFLAVDRLSRSGAVRLSRVDRGGYRVTLGGFAA
jgi:hypothetical protein